MNIIQIVFRSRSDLLACAAVGALLTLPVEAGLLPGVLQQQSLGVGFLPGSTVNPAERFQSRKLIETSVPEPGLGVNVAALLGANAFYDQGLTGQGTRTAVIDSGLIWNGHFSLPHVSEYVYDPSAWDDPGTVGDQQSDLFDAHATSIGQIIGGRVSTSSGKPLGVQIGIAPDTYLVSGATATSFIAFASSSYFDSVTSVAMPYAASFGNVDVISTSWGEEDSFGALAKTVMLDGLAYANPTTTHVIGAGNGGDPDGDPQTPPITNSVWGPASGYNSITVGALQNNGANVYDSVADFSSRGPQAFYFIEIVDDFPMLTYCLACRAAVDLVAPGTDLLAAAYFGQTGSNNPTLPDTPGFPPELAGEADNYFVGLSGTSFATPIVAGAATLINSASYNTPELAANPHSRDARVVKAVLLNSADKISGWTNNPFEFSFGGPVFEATLQGLDYASGAGALNIARAYDQYLGEATTKDVPGFNPGDQGLVSTTGWDFGSVEIGVDSTYLFEEALIAGSTFTATLTWFRERAFDTDTFGLKDIGQADLDLYLLDALSGDIVAVSGSSYNMVEHLYFQVPKTSSYLLLVSMSGAVAGEVGTVEYGLAWSATSVPEPSSALLCGVCCFVVLISWTNCLSARSLLLPNPKLCIN